ncbi:MAG: flavodoxin family protein [Oscillospiraceae bacterium]|nr:flavodoxin family protein [Oscillospiraceae bacterium]
MKVILLNGSPNKKGTTWAALSEAAKVLNERGIEAEIFHPEMKPIQPCLGCAVCHKSGEGKCFYNEDGVNEFIEKAKTADGFIFGSPVHYASASGFITTFLDRAFFAGSRFFKHKPGANVVCCRRGGASATFDQLNKYFTIASVPVVSSQYWNMVYGSNAEQAKLDEEGMQTMRTLAENMAWLLKCIDAGKAAGIDVPALEAPIHTNFIR